MQKGAPSLNPAGRGVTKAKRAPGSDGVISYGGYVQDGEKHRDLIGTQKWITYRNALFHPAVAIASLLRFALLRGLRWQLTENPAGGADAERGLDIVEQGLLSARLPKPFANVVPKAAMAWANGFSLHAAALGRRSDGLVVYTDIGHRPAHTIERWNRKSPQDPWDSVEQRLADGHTYTIPLSECLYVVNDAFTDSPEGMGVLRLVVERLRRVNNYEAREGSEVFSSLGGVPIGRVPLEIIDKALEGVAEEERASRRAAMIANVEIFLRDRIKTPEKLQYLILDSAVFEGVDPNIISSIYKWSIEILKGEVQGLVEVRKIITDLDLDIARVLGIEWVYMGASSTGSLAMHADKTSMFASTLQGDANMIARCADQQLVRRLIKANGLNPDTAAPTLTPGAITGKDVEKVARTLGLVNMAGLPKNHPAKIAMFEMLELPWQDEDDLLGAEMLPRRPFASRDDGETVTEIDDETDEEITDAD